MASTLGIYGKVNPAEVNKVRGVRRSRFSFHFLTHRTRRWLLVQWVSVPVAPSEEDQLAYYRQTLASNKPPTFKSLLSDYTNQAWLRRNA
ncbi:MAG TPA: hypothetical protein VJ183_18750 [Chloroflexia bacterium]|nr:hypothetical protein [Chloroflexia bacterium]